MPERKKHPGHFCWACNRQRPNEKFSGKGHARHVCRTCARLGPDELAYRQELRNLERCITLGGTISRKQRTVFQRFLRHEDPRIRAMAEELQQEDEKNRELARADWEAEEAFEALFDDVPP